MGSRHNLERRKRIMSGENRIKDTALLFEGGGMRASYTAGILTILLEKQLYFDYVAGISAGSSHTVNYLARDPWRARTSFVDLVRDPQFGGWGSFLQGKGFFNAQYIYEQTPYPGEALPLDFDKFQACGARVRIGAMERDRGQLHYFTEQDIRELSDLAKIVRASSSMPVFMPPTEYRGKVYVDGGLGGGIPLDIGLKDGLSRFFVVLTREKGYRKKPIKYTGIMKLWYRKYPEVVEAMVARHRKYNETLEQLEQLELEGRAFLVYPDRMPVSSRETNLQKLRESYASGYAQGQRDFKKWKTYLQEGSE